MNDDVVTSAQTRVRVEIPDTTRAYDLRPPTFGEVGDMAAHAEGTMVPSDAIFAEAVREAIAASAMPQADKDRHAAALDEYFAADDALRSLYASLPDSKDWTAEHRREVADANRAMRGASRARDLAEWAVRDVPAVREMKRSQGVAGRREQAGMVALCLGWDVARVMDLPAGDFLLLQQRATRMMRPDQAAEKN